MKKEVVLTEQGVIGIVLANHGHGNKQVMWYEDGIQFIMTLEQDEYTTFEELEDD